MILAVWSRTWIGSSCLLVVPAVIVWLFVNLRLLLPCTGRAVGRRGTYGKRTWLDYRDALPADDHAVLRLLVVLGVAGFGSSPRNLFALDV